MQDTLHATSLQHYNNIFQFPCRLVSLSDRIQNGLEKIMFTITRFSICVSSTKEELKYLYVNELKDVCYQLYGSLFDIFPCTKLFIYSLQKVQTNKIKPV